MLWAIILSTGLARAHIDSKIIPTIPQNSPRISIIILILEGNKIPAETWRARYRRGHPLSTARRNGLTSQEPAGSFRCNAVSL